MSNKMGPVMPYVFNLKTRPSCQTLSNALEISRNTARVSTLYNVCAVPWGVFSTVGGYHEYRGGIS